MAANDWCIRLCVVSLFMLVVLLALAPPACAQGFKVGMELSTQVPVSHAVEAALRDMGIGCVNYYVAAYPGSPDLPPSETNKAMMDLCDRLDLEFSLSCHQIDPPEECVREAVERGGERFRGVVFDELAHARLLNHFSPTSLADYGEFKSFDQAYEETTKGYQALHDKYAAMGSPVTATHMWPLLNHTAAKTGFIVCPKICKELYSSVNFAIAMGAAKQYGADLWADCDLWFWDLIPGHSPEEFKSNLMMAYWLGADLVYVEGSGYNLKPAGKQGIPFSLMNQATPDTYQLTPHGEVLRWFNKTYLPAHPRSWTFRDVKPNIAIIRFEDTDHGQRYTGDWKDDLYGAPNLKSSRDTEAWFGIWNLLTFGKTGRDGLSLFKAWVGPSGYQRAVQNDLAASYLTRPVQADMHRFFVPLNGVVVYDHRVGYDLLKDVPLLFLTGLKVSDETMAAVRRRVEAGAICVAWGPLAAKHGFGDWKGGVDVVEQGKGKFVLTDDFGYRQVYQEIKTMIGRPDEIRYRFGQNQVVLRRVSDNEISVETYP